MILKSAIRAFLERPRDDLRVYKTYSPEKLEQIKDALPVRPPIWQHLRHHQKVGFIVGARYRHIAYHFDMGTGKSCMAVALMRYFRRLGIINKVLIIVPYQANTYEWQLEIEKHSPSTPCTVLAGSSERKWQLLRESEDLFVVVTAMGFVRMLCELQPRKKSKKEKLVPVKKWVDEAAALFDGLIIDESNTVGNHLTLPFRICRQLTKNAQASFELTGTPFGNDPTALWSQMFLIDKGESLGASLGLYRAAFFKEKYNPFSAYPDYEFDERKKALLHRFLAHRSLRYEADAADLPRVVSIIKQARLPTDIADYYEQAKKMLIRAHGNYNEMKNTFLRMRQISSGFLGYKDDETGAKAQFEFNYNPKLDLLLSIIEVAHQDAKIMIAHDFIYSGNMIARDLKKMKIGFAQINGQMRGKIQEERRRFQEDDNCRVFVINTAGAYGLNLQLCKYQIFFESPPSPVLRQQMERRVERQESQHDRIFRYELFGAPVDAQIRRAHIDGKNLFDSIVNGETIMPA